MFTPMGEFIIQSVVQWPPVNCLMFSLISLLCFGFLACFCFFRLPGITTEALGERSLGTERIGEISCLRPFPSLKVARQDARMHLEKAPRSSNMPSNLVTQGCAAKGERRSSGNAMQLASRTYRALLTKCTSGRMVNDSQVKMGYCSCPSNTTKVASLPASSATNGKTGRASRRTSHQKFPLPK